MDYGNSRSVCAQRVLILAIFCGLAFLPGRAVGEPFDLVLEIANPQDFTADQLAIVEAASAEAEALWEGLITGYQPGIDLPGIGISVKGAASGVSGLALANVTGSLQQSGFRLSTRGVVSINLNIVEEFADYLGAGENFIDDIMAHEIGHVLGIGTQWTSNHVYTFRSGEYTGPYGVAAYRREFDADADSIPVELAGGAATANKHWDQIMRSSAQEGDPSDPLSLSPLLGITDAQGRDLALELMTGAIDPDYGEPFMSRTTLQSLRDLGFQVVPEPGSAALLLLAVATIAVATAAGYGTRRRHR
jgi:hypothetical protein